MLPHDWIDVIHFGQEKHGNNVVFFSVHHVRRHMILICPITVDTSRFL